MSPEITSFLGRLTRLDPAALVRVRGGELWAQVPWGVLVTRTVTGLAAQRTVRAAAWLAHGGDDPDGCPSLDADWRIGLPSAAVVVAETIPTGVLRQLSHAAAETLREAATGGLNGRAVGARVLRDGLLDHVPIVVAAAGGQDEVRVPQRLIQAVARMDFLGADGDPTEVLVAAGWIGIGTGGGRAWWRSPSTLVIHRHRA